MVAERLRQQQRAEADRLRETQKQLGFETQQRQNLGTSSLFGPLRRVSRQVLGFG